MNYDVLSAEVAKRCVAGGGKEAATLASAAEFAGVPTARLSEAQVAACEEIAADMNVPGAEVVTQRVVTAREVLEALGADEIAKLASDATGFVLYLQVVGELDTAEGAAGRGLLEKSLPAEVAAKVVAAGAEITKPSAAEVLGLPVVTVAHVASALECIAKSKVGSEVTDDGPS
jgi:hypothetical protein